MTDRIDLVRLQRAITTTANGTVVTGIAAGANGSTSQLVLDSAGNVGIGTASPANRLHVTAATDAAIRLVAQSGRADLILSATTDTVINNISNTPMIFTTNNTERMRIDASGRITKPNTPAFSVNSRQITGFYSNVTVVYKNVAHNNGGHYSTTTGRFTAPVAGRYFFSASGIASSASGGNAQLTLTRNNGSIQGVYIDLISAFIPVTVTAVIDLAVNDYVSVLANASVAAWYDNGGSVVEYNNFSGFLIG
jgi:hypothetical protein